MVALVEAGEAAVAGRWAEVEARPAAFLISPDVLASTASPSTSMLTNVRTVDLSGNHLRSMEGLANLVHLETLRLNHNEIARIEGLSRCTALTVLELGFNALDSVASGLRALSRLRRLRLDHNYLERYSSVNVLKK